MNIFRYFRVKEKKICSITHHSKNVSGKHAPEPLSKRLATPRSIHSGRQLIVCSIRYMFMHYKIFIRGQKITNIVAQHILKCNTWELFSNTMCP